MTKEKLQTQILNNLKNRIEVWKNNKDGASPETVENEIKLCEKTIKNIEEATSIVAVRKATHLLELYLTDQLEKAYNTGLITKGDKIDSILNNIDVPKTTLLNIRNTSLWDEYIQQIYETMGYETKLPTHSEIKALEYELEKLKANGADESQIIDIEEKLNLKKCALGELTYQMHGEIPYYLSSDVKHQAEQERKINTAASNITR